MVKIVCSDCGFIIELLAVFMLDLQFNFTKVHKNSLRWRGLHVVAQGGGTLRNAAAPAFSVYDLRLRI
jgi:hypothetical protein